MSAEDNWESDGTESVDMGFRIRDNADLRGLLELASILETDVMTGLRKIAAKDAPATQATHHAQNALAVNLKRRKGQV